MRSLEERLRSAIAGIEERDGKLRDELAAVRASSKPAAMELAGGLESMGFGTPEGGGGPRAAPDLALETIVLRTGCPVLAVFNDQAKLEFNDADSEVWRARLVAAKEQLGRAIRAVGRIEVEHHPRQMDWLGTGWLVAPDVIVTNRHVAQEFGLRRGEGFVFKQGLGGTMTARIDFLEEYGRAAAREFKVTNVLHIQDEPGPDVAFLKVEQRAGDGLAAPIVLARGS